MHSESGNDVLPLFRREALASRQHKLYGEILLIHPFSLVFLTCLAIAITGGVFGYLLLGHYTEKAKLSGTIVDHGATAEITVPVRFGNFIRRGDRIAVRCRGCSSSQSARIEQISSADSNPATTTTQEPIYKVRIALASPADQSLQPGTEVEADLSLGRKPLLKWLFEKQGT